MSYRAARRRLLAARGPATGQACAECGQQARFWCYDGSDSDEHTTRIGDQRYSLDPARYRARCGSCHRITTAGHQPVTPAASGRAVELYAAGVGLTAIARQLGVTRPAVRTALTVHGVILRRSSPAGAARVDAERIVELYAAGASLREVAGRLGVTRPAVRAALATHGAVLRPPGRIPAHTMDVDRAAALYAAGAGLRGIATVLGVSRPAVRAALVERGVAIRPPGRTRRVSRRTDDPTAFDVPRDVPTAASPEPGPSPPVRPAPPRVLFRPLPTTSRQPPHPSPNNPS